MSTDSSKEAPEVQVKAPHLPMRRMDRARRTPQVNSMQPDFGSSLRVMMRVIRCLLAVYTATLRVSQHG